MQSRPSNRSQKSSSAYASTLLMLLIAGMTAKSALGASYNNSPTEKHFALTSNSIFNAYKTHAAEYLKSQNWHRSTSMCALGESIDNEQQVWFVWRDGKKLILWDEPDMPLNASRRILKIPRDVVANEKAINGSTYKVTQAWVRDLTGRCSKYGTTFKISQTPTH
jgi:hypothetical protein